MKALRTYQQVFLYVIPTITNLGVVNTAVVVARIVWFKKKLKAAGNYFLLFYKVPWLAETMIRSAQSDPRPTPKGVIFSLRREEEIECQTKILEDALPATYVKFEPHVKLSVAKKYYSGTGQITSDKEVPASADGNYLDSSASESKPRPSTSTEYYIPPPLERDNGTSRQSGTPCDFHMVFFKI